MDISKTWQKYKQEIKTCLCFSVMGQRRFRISMGTLIASPEAGDALVNIIPQMKEYCITGNHSKNFNYEMSGRDNIVRRSLICSFDYNNKNDTNENDCEGGLLMQNDICDEISSDIVTDTCQFPYYRSSKHCTQCSDTVLVKDVGISCKLLSQNGHETSISETKSYLVEQLKREYSDLFNITNKITAYTKDILQHLSKKDQKKQGLFQNLVSSKHAVASQYVNSEGNLCLKLRLLNNTETQSTRQTVKKYNDTTSHKGNIVEKPKNEYCNFLTRLYTTKNQIVYNTKHKKEAQTIFLGRKVKTSTSSFSSQKTSSIYNYLTMRKRKSSNEMLKSTLINNYKNNDHKEHLKQCSSITFTNWKEISKSKQSKTKILSASSNKSRATLMISRHM
ncbi:uncharacterized protein LOC116426481 [Nomia melanderi]|uniref:uncharacterized protein LOC116426481 n=1 Tax=Nomia melanderi TaxID=2448451 RepID=UPI003FCDB52B